jgi:hypothetical protein
MLNLKEKLAPLRSVTGSVKDAMINLRNKIGDVVEKVDGPVMMAAGLTTRSTGLQAKALEDMTGMNTANAGGPDIGALEKENQKSLARQVGYATDELGNKTERLPLEERLQIARENPSNLNELLSEDEQKRIEVIKKEDTVLEKVRRAFTGEDLDMEVRILPEENKPTETKAAEPQTVTEAPTFNHEGFDANAFTKAIQYTESRGKEDPYKAVGPTKDLGKYQASPSTLNDWSEPWLGKKYTPEEFLADPDAQETFFKQYLAVVNRLKLTPEQAAVAWHRGWGELGTGPRETRDERFLADLNAKINDETSQNYLNTFRIGLQQ